MELMPKRLENSMSVLLNSWLPVARASRRKTLPKSKAHSKNGNAALENVAQAELPTRNGRFTIYGFKGLGPQDEAVALVGLGASPAMCWRRCAATAGRSSNYR